MPSKVKLHRIQPSSVHQIWPLVEPMLKSAIDRTGLSAWRAISDDILYGHGLLWVCQEDSGKILCAGATSLQKTDSGMVCVITACGGTDMCRWLPLLEKIEAYAKAENCRCTRILGRKGWLRVLDGYSVQSVVLEKEMT